MGSGPVALVRQWQGRFEHWFVGAHLRLYQSTGGRLGHRLIPTMTSLVLTTTGRRSGEPRPVCLTYVADGDGWLVVGSGFGRPTPPAWFLNLGADPRAEVLVGRRRVEVEAELFGPDDERYGEMWRRATAREKKRYERYRTTNVGNRAIDVVRLAPRTATPGP